MLGIAAPPSPRLCGTSSFGTSWNVKPIGQLAKNPVGVEKVRQRNAFLGWEYHPAEFFLSLRLGGGWQSRSHFFNTHRRLHSSTHVCGARTRREGA
jgi:hypothetical protein